MYRPVAMIALRASVATCWRPPGAANSGRRISHGSTSIDTNAYFDAETWTALAAYRRAFPGEARVEEILREVDAALMRKYGAEFRLPFFHWGTMAAALRYSDRRDREFLEFIRAQTTEFLNQVERHPDNDNNCAAVEGVIDAIGTLRDAGEPGGALTCGRCAGRVQR